MSSSILINGITVRLPSVVHNYFNPTYAFGRELTEGVLALRDEITGDLLLPHDAAGDIAVVPGHAYTLVCLASVCHALPIVRMVPDACHTKKKRHDGHEERYDESVREQNGKPIEQAITTLPMAAALGAKQTKQMDVEDGLVACPTLIIDSNLHDSTNKVQTSPLSGCRTDGRTSMDVYAVCDNKECRERKEGTAAAVSSAVMPLESSSVSSLSVAAASALPDALLLHESIKSHPSALPCSTLEDAGWQQQQQHSAQKKHKRNRVSGEHDQTNASHTKPDHSSAGKTRTCSGAVPPENTTLHTTQHRTGIPPHRDTLVPKSSRTPGTAKPTTITTPAASTATITPSTTDERASKSARTDTKQTRKQDRHSAYKDVVHSTTNTKTLLLVPPPDPLRDAISEGKNELPPPFANDTMTTNDSTVTLQMPPTTEENAYSPLVNHSLFDMEKSTGVATNSMSSKDDQQKEGLVVDRDASSFTLAVRHDYAEDSSNAHPHTAADQSTTALLSAATVTPPPTKDEKKDRINANARNDARMQMCHDNDAKGNAYNDRSSLSDAQRESDDAEKPGDNGCNSATHVSVLEDAASQSPITTDAAESAKAAPAAADVTATKLHDSATEVRMSEPVHTARPTLLTRRIRHPLDCSSDSD